MTKGYTVYHVMPAADSWIVSVEGTPRGRTFKMRDRAISYAMAEAKMNTPSKLAIHKKDGTIEERTYADDPYPPKARK